MKCEAYRTSEGHLFDTCGEPCSWQRGKAGHGYPPNAGEPDFYIGLSDEQNADAYFLRVGIGPYKIVVDD